MVAEGQLRYVYCSWEQFGTQPNASMWVAKRCEPVRDYDVAKRNPVPPDATEIGAEASAVGVSMQVTLYDCSVATP